MNVSLCVLLTGLIDYAGMFPPARLSRAEAIRNYAKYRKQENAWMLGRFILPAGQLLEVKELMRGFFLPATPLSVSALGTGGDWIEEFLDNLQSDLRAILTFRQLHPKHVQVDGFEVRLPADAVADNRKLADLLDRVAATKFTQPGEYYRLTKEKCEAYELTKDTGDYYQVCQLDGLTVFYEIANPAKWAEDFSRVITSLAQFNRTRTGGLTVGFKLRCGGVEKAAFPGIEQVALCLHECITNAVPFKATAGLHHPFPRFDPGLQVRMHGFINVFGGGVLAAKHQFGSSQLEEILADDDPDHFHFSGDGFRWRDFQVSASEILQTRSALLTSFGSCSFDEPREDLRTLGWL